MPPPERVRQDVLQGREAASGIVDFLGHRDAGELLDDAHVLQTRHLAGVAFALGGAGQDWACLGRGIRQPPRSKIGQKLQT